MNLGRLKPALVLERIGWVVVFEPSARFRDAYPQPEPDLPQPVKGNTYLVFKVRGKFAEIEPRPFGIYSEGSCPGGLFQQ